MQINAKNSKAWAPNIEFLMLRQLVSGTNPAATPDNVASIVKVNQTNQNGITNELPKVGSAREFRGIVNVIAKTMSSIRIGNAIEWKQVHADGTSRRQVQLLSLFIKAKEVMAQ